MDVSALTLATPGATPEEGGLFAPAAVAAGGDAFARLLSGLGVAAPAVGVNDPTAVAADILPAEAAPAAGEAPPADPALLLTGKPMPPTMPRPAKAEAGKATTLAVGEDRKPDSETEAPTPASLGLPPLLAALVAPTLAQASPPKPISAGPPEAPAILAAPPGAGTTSSAPSPVVAAPLVPFAAPALPVAGSGDTAATAIVPTTLPAAAAEPAAGSASPRPTETAMAAAPLPDAVTVPTERPAPSASAETRKGAIPAPVGRAAAQLALAEPAAAPLAAAVAALPSVTPRRTPSLPAASDDAVAPAKGSDNAAPITDIALPLAPRPMPVAAPLAPAPDLAPSVSAAAPLDPAPLAEPLIEHQLDMAREGEWLDQLTRDIVRTASAEGSLRFRLNPEHLGSLQVEVTQGQAGASVRLTADTEQARSLIADARPQLIAEARAQGVRIAEAHVDLSGRGESQGGGSPAHSQAGTGGRGGRDVPAQEYLTSWQPESAEEEATPSRRASAERYA